MSLELHTSETGEENSEVDEEASETANLVARGTILNGHYQVLRRIASGSMGTVYLCRHTILSSRLLAVKVIAPEIANDSVALQRFYDEVTATYDLQHPNVIRTFDLFRNEQYSGFSMEYVEGGDLLDLLDAEEELELSTIIELLLQICDGLGAIHDLGIVHRDLKPENILLTEDQQVKIADFGIAQLNHASRKTLDGHILGAIDYVSPEYIVHGHFDKRSDIYAVGMLAYRMITGGPAFSEGSVFDTLQAHVQNDPPPLRESRQECSVELEQIVLRAVARDPEDRYQDVSELYEDLLKLQEKEKNPIQRAEYGSSHLLSWCIYVLASVLITLGITFGDKNIDLFQLTELVPQSRQPVAITVSAGAEITKKIEPQAADSTPFSETLTHKVKYSGESLSLLSLWYTGEMLHWKLIASQNPDLDPRRIRIGQVIEIPSEIVVREDAPTPQDLKNLRQEIRGTAKAP